MMEKGRSGQVSRRDAIRLGVGAGLGTISLLRGDFGLSRLLSAQGGAPWAATPPGNPAFPKAPSWKTELRKLAPNVFAYIQAGGPDTYPEGTRFAGGRGVANNGVIVGEDHLLVVDTLGQPFHVKAFVSAVRRTIGNKPFGRIVNTHHHSDHVNGNQFFTPIEIVGHTFCRQMVLQMSVALPPDAAFIALEGAADGSEQLKLVAPNVTFDDKMTYRYQGTIVELMHLGVGHTWGDVVVYLPEHKIMFAGDVLNFYTVPFSFQGRISTWIKVIEKIMDMDVETIVPGHGPIGGRREMEDVRDYFVLLTREARKRYDAGTSAGRAASEIKLGKFDNWIGSERVLMNTCRLYEEFNGTLQPNFDVGFMTRAAEEFNAIHGTA